MNNPIVKGQYQTADNPIFEVFYLENPHGVIADFSGNPILWVVLNSGISHIRRFMRNNTAIIKRRENLVSTRTITMTALLAAISYILAFLEFPVHLSPSFSEFLSFIQTKLDVVLFNAMPFNIIKGLVIGAITMIIYKKLTPVPVLKGETLR